MSRHPSIWPTEDAAETEAAAIGHAAVWRIGATHTWVTIPNELDAATILTQLAGCPGLTRLAPAPSALIPTIVPPAPARPTTPRVRNTDPQTSRDAAEDVQPADIWTVLDVHRRHPDGVTDHELAAITGRVQTSVGKRRGELRDLGLIEDTGTTRLSPSGAPCSVWRITPPGRSITADQLHAAKAEHAAKAVA